MTFCHFTYLKAMIISLFGHFAEMTIGTWRLGRGQYSVSRFPAKLQMGRGAYKTGDGLRIRLTVKDLNHSVKHTLKAMAINKK